MKIKQSHIKILFYVKDGLSVSEIAKNIKKAVSTTSEHLKNLEKEGYIVRTIKSSITNFGLTKKAEMMISEFLRPCDETETTPLLIDRAHNIKIKALISKPPKNVFWKGWDSKKLKNVIFYRRYFGDILMEYQNNGFLFQLPILYFKNSEEAMLEAGRIVKVLIENLEAEHEGLKFGTPEKLSHVVSQSHAVPHDIYARFLWKNKISYKDEKIDIDASKNIPEIEFTDRETSDIDHTSYCSYVRDFIINKPLNNSELQQSLEKQVKLINIFMEGQKELGVHIHSHIKAIQTLGTNTTHNTQTINKLAEQVTLLTQLIAKMTPKQRRKDLDDY